MKRETLILFIALASGIAAFGMIFNFLKEARKPVISYVMTVKAVKKGQALEVKDLAMSNPLKNVPAQTYYAQMSDVIDRQAVEDIPESTLVARSMIKTVEKPAPQVAVPAPPEPVVKKPSALPIPAAKRALTLSVRELEVPPDSIKVGNYVDILSTVDKNEIRTVLNSIQVIAVGLSEKEVLESVTLALTPLQVEKVLTFSKFEKLRLLVSTTQGDDSSSVSFIEIIRGVEREKKAL